MQPLSSGHGFETPRSGYSLKPDGPASIAFRSAHRGAAESLKSGLSFIDSLPPSPDSNVVGLTPGCVVEFYGPQGSGKTEVVLNLIASYVLPKRLHGHERPVVFLDLDLRLNIERLEALIQAKIEGEEDRDGLIMRECLARILIARCFDEVDILAALVAIRGQIDGWEPFLLVIDSLAPLHYSAKLAESCRSERSTLHNSIYRAIARLATQSAATVLAVKPCLLLPKRLHDNLGPYIEHREFMSKMWRGIVTHRLDFMREECSDNDVMSLDPTTIFVRTSILKPPSSGTPPCRTVFRFQVRRSGCLEEEYTQQEEEQ